MARAGVRWDDDTVVEGARIEMKAAATFDAGDFMGAAKLAAPVSTVEIG